MAAEVELPALKLKGPLPVLVTAEDVEFKTLLPELVAAGNVPPKKPFPLLLAAGVSPKILLPAFVIPEYVPPKMLPAVLVIAQDVPPSGALVGLPKLGSFVLTSVVSLVDGTDETEVDGTDPNLKTGVTVKEGAAAEMELLFLPKFSIAKAVVVALILLLATMLAETLDEF